MMRGKSIAASRGSYLTLEGTEAQIAALKAWMKRRSSARVPSASTTSSRASTRCAAPRKLASELDAGRFPTVDDLYRPAAPFAPCDCDALEGGAIEPVTIPQLP